LDYYYNERMPELPEVETIKNELVPYIKGKRIKDIVIKRKEIIGFPNHKSFVKKSKGKKIINIRRRGKYLIFELNNGNKLLFHLKLSGRLFLINDLSPDCELKYERLRLVLNHQGLSFIEPRMFGRVYLIQKNIPKQLKGFQELGPEPLERDFNKTFLKAKLKNRKGKIKSLLLDQRIGCGIGNIYADESLFRAKIHPKRSGATLSDDEITRLVRAIKICLKAAIRYKGTTLSDYFRPKGIGGNYASHLLVKAREGKPCFICGTLIQREKISNRSTHFCPRCQK